MCELLVVGSFKKSLDSLDFLIEICFLCLFFFISYMQTGKNDQHNYNNNNKRHAELFTPSFLPKHWNANHAQLDSQWNTEHQQSAKALWIKASCLECMLLF